ncbi:MAG: nitroreductase family protein [Acidimicrobiales bacterium]
MDDIATLFEARFGLAPQHPQPGAPTDTEATMLRHRICRRYADEPVDEATLERILAATLSTPAKSDLQQVAIIVVDDPERRRRIAELIGDMPWIVEASRFLLFCGDGRRIRRLCEHHGVPFGNDHLDAVLNPASDAAMHLSSCVWAAESLGLGTCPISVVRNHLDAVTEICELPPLVFPLAGLCIGHRADRGHRVLRLAPAVTVHRDRYDDANALADIDAYDRRRDAVFSIPPAKQLHTDRFGVAGFYGWSLDKARQVSRPERTDLAAYLRRQGFRFDPEPDPS